MKPANAVTHVQYVWGREVTPEIAAEAEEAAIIGSLTGKAKKKRLGKIMLKKLLELAPLQPMPPSS